VIEENNESESDRGKSEVKNDNLGKDIVKHVKLPEEESTTQGHYVDSIYESRGAVHSPATAPSQKSYVWFFFARLCTKKTLYGNVALDLCFHSNTFYIFFN
jgi:hypothetical protein